MAPSHSPRELTVSVRDLVEFVLRTGDLGGDGGFVTATRALEGVRAHQRIQRSRPEGYRSEVSLSQTIDGDGFNLTIKGRLDGFLKTANSLIIEEIKTVGHGWNGNSDPLHWAQAKVYAHLLLNQETAESVIIQLTYHELETGLNREFQEEMPRTAVTEFFRAVVGTYLEWTADRVRWWGVRDQSIANLCFPYAQYRPGQRKLAVAVYRTLTSGGALFADAPTGIGKTMSVLFPAIKAMGEGHFCLLFYLTAKTIARTVVELALTELRQRGLRFRSVTLTAKDKVCQRDGQACDPQTCPLTRGYYDRLKPALRDGLSRESLTRDTIQELGQRHQVCPFELSLDLALWTDAVICDYNYVFDPKVYLRRFFADGPGDYGFLIDEAHNLVERARDMFSAELRRSELLETLGQIGAAVPQCSGMIQRIVNSWPGEDLFELSGNTADPDAPRAQQELPASFVQLLQRFLEMAQGWLVQDQSSPAREFLLNTYFQLHGFVRTASFYDEHFVTLIDRERVRLFCLDPSDLIRGAVERGKAAVFFSGTLTPLEYFRSILGRGDEDTAIQLPSPFPQENFRILVADTIATALRHRQSSYDQVSQAIASFIRGRTGNYLVYFPSYRYMEEVVERFRQLCPEVQAICQSSGMAENEREKFLAAFHRTNESTLVGFAVLGGVFGEGIDLTGERLIGVVVVGVGLPQICLERDLIRGYYDEQDRSGYDYAYTFPGMNRVLQAVGRVIRSETDLGMALLIDVRFGQARYQELMPRWWMPVRVANPEEIQTEVRRFWNSGL